MTKIQQQQQQQQTLFSQGNRDYQVIFIQALLNYGATTTRTQLEFKPPPQQLPSRKSKRQRNAIWFNPPYNKNVKTNIERAFISLIERSFPAGQKLRKIFNRNTIKLRYSCMPNVKQIIDGHNKAFHSNFFFNLDFKRFM